MDGGTLDYDFLLVATGAGHSYFGMDAWARFAPGLKTLEDALEIRRRFLLTFEQAEREPDPATRRALLTYVVVGGGATGVELAGTLKEIASRTLGSLERTPRKFREGPGRLPRNELFPVRRPPGLVAWAHCRSPGGRSGPEEPP